MLNIEEFKQELKDFVKYLPEEVRTDIKDIEFQKVVKDGGRNLTTFAPVLKSVAATPTFYVEPLYSEYTKQYVEGAWDAEEMKKDMALTFLNAVANIPQELLNAPENIINLDTLKNNTIFKTITIDGNEDLLKDCIWTDADLNLAFVFVVKIGDSVTLPIKKEMLDMFPELTEAEFISRAIKNTLDNYPAELYEGGRMLSGDCINMLKGNKNWLNPSEVMYVLTNSERLFGFNSLFYPDIKDKLLDLFEDDVIAIPSSIDEVIIMPASKITIDEALDIHNRAIKSGPSEPGKFVTKDIFYLDANGYKRIENN